MLFVVHTIRPMPEMSCLTNLVVSAQGPLLERTAQFRHCFHIALTSQPPSRRCVNLCRHGTGAAHCGGHLQQRKTVENRSCAALRRFSPSVTGHWHGDARHLADAWSGAELKAHGISAGGAEQRPRTRAARMFAQSGELACVLQRSIWCARESNSFDRCRNGYVAYCGSQRLS